MTVNQIKILEKVVDNKYSIVSATYDLKQLYELEANVLNDIHKSYSDEIARGLMEHEEIESLAKEAHEKIAKDIDAANDCLKVATEKEEQLKSEVESLGQEYHEFLERNKVDDLLDCQINGFMNFEEAYKYVSDELMEQNIGREKSLNNLKELDRE